MNITTFFHYLGLNLYKKLSHSANFFMLKYNLNLKNILQNIVKSVLISFVRINKFILAGDCCYTVIWMPMIFIYYAVPFLFIINSISQDTENLPGTVSRVVALQFCKHFSLGEFKITFLSKIVWHVWKFYLLFK